DRPLVTALLADFLEVVGGPDVEEPLVIHSKERLAVASEGERAEDGGPGPLQKLAAAGVPQAQGVVLGAGSQEALVGAQGQARYPVAVALERAPLRVRRTVPHGEGVPVALAAVKESAVGREDDRRGTVALANRGPGRQVAHRYLPPPDDAEGVVRQEDQ